MSQIIGGHTFVPLEKNIDDVKLNAITGGATITSELISTQTQTTSTGSGDYFLLLQSGGTLAKILTSDLANSLGSSSGMINAITSVRLRSFNAVGNPSFEVDQRQCGNIVNLVAGTSSAFIDRWNFAKAGATFTLNCQQQAALTANPVVPGTNFVISRAAASVTVVTSQATLAAGDYIQINQQIEGPLLRELIGDVTSISLMVYCTSAPVSFSIRLLNLTGTAYSYTKLFTITAASTWQLVTIPNIPKWPAGGTWPLNAGSAGYLFSIGLGAGSTYTAPSDGAWNAGSFICSPGNTNFASLANATFLCAFVQHEPGPQCTTLIDKPFSQNYDKCLRYYCKSWDYGTAVGTATSTGCQVFTVVGGLTSWAGGTVTFPKRLARDPVSSPQIWAPDGTINAASAIGGATVGNITNFAGQGQSGFSGFNPTSGAFAANSLYQFHYVADTGW